MWKVHQNALFHTKCLKHFLGRAPPQTPPPLGRGDTSPQNLPLGAYGASIKFIPPNQIPGYPGVIPCTKERDPPPTLKTWLRPCSELNYKTLQLKYIKLNIYFLVIKHSLICTQKFRLIFLTLTMILSKIVLCVLCKMQKNNEVFSQSALAPV